MAADQVRHAYDGRTVERQPVCVVASLGPRRKNMTHMNMTQDRILRQRRSNCFVSTVEFMPRTLAHTKTYYYTPVTLTDDILLPQFDSICVRTHPLRITRLPTRYYTEWSRIRRSFTTIRPCGEPDQCRQNYGWLKTCVETRV